MSPLLYLALGRFGAGRNSPDFNAGFGHSDGSCAEIFAAGPSQPLLRPKSATLREEESLAFENMGGIIRIAGSLGRAANGGKRASMGVLGYADTTPGLETRFWSSLSCFFEQTAAFYGKIR